MTKTLLPLERDTIPIQILNEIRAAYPTADYHQYGTIDDQTLSFKLDYRLKEPLTETAEVVNTTTFEPETVDGSTHELVTLYMVRANAEGTTIRGVYPLGPLVAPIQ